MHAEIKIRPVEKTDMSVLADLEKSVWTSLGTPIVSEAEIAEWYTEHSAFFLIAECEGKACGYYFGRQIHFLPERMNRFLDRSLVTGKGFSRHVHSSSGNTLYGINICSTVQGTGRALYKVVHDILEKKRLEYSVGITRLNGFNSYLGDQEANDAIALWYARESAEALGIAIWPQCPEKPLLSLPPIPEPDPVLAFHVRGTNYGLAGILPEYMVDPASRNYGAVILSRFPHR